MPKIQDPEARNSKKRDIGSSYIQEKITGGDVISIIDHHKHPIISHLSQEIIYKNIEYVVVLNLTCGGH